MFNEVCISETRRKFDERKKKLTFGLKAHFKYKILNVTPELLAKT